MNAETHPETKRCAECSSWKPKYHGVGSCAAEGMPNAKMWVANPQSELLTIASFCCQAFTEKQALERDIL